MEEEIELTPTQEKVLLFVFSNPDLAFPKGIGNFLESDPTAASKHLKNLKEKGLVKKKGKPTPQQFYVITSKGSQTLVRHLNSHSDSSCSKLRVHKMTVRVEVVGGIETVESNEMKEVELRNTYQLHDEVETRHNEKVRTRFASGSMFIHIPEVVCKPTEQGIFEAHNRALDIAENVKQKYRSKYEEIKFGRTRPKIEDAETAYVGHVNALTMVELDEPGEIFKESDVQMVVDESTGSPELEIKGRDYEEKLSKLLRNTENMTKMNFKDEIESLKENISKNRKRIGRLEKALQILSKQGLRNTVETVEKIAKKTVENQISG